MRQEHRSPSTAVIPRLVRTGALRRGIQYAAASRFNHHRLRVLDRPVKQGDDTECGAKLSPHRHCEHSEAIQNLCAVAVWIASRSLSSGRASRGPVGSQ
ncbi:hypothetical protein E4K65_27185 [Bradyrhizobium niftali]|uniref:Uncharacterized protein n=1 Tax=Bradyrhizobium niftali TaxID=2560055 RepID=A0A4Y9LMM5_9BRAD|nr:hypothetical protein E4K65_27185 [Bradyrhizobium niftali]